MLRPQRALRQTDCCTAGCTAGCAEGFGVFRDGPGGSGSFRTAVAAALTAQWQTLAPAEGEAKKKVANTSTVDLHVALELAVPPAEGEAKKKVANTSTVD